jgi:hypothetical protein
MSAAELLILTGASGLPTQVRMIMCNLRNKNRKIPAQVTLEFVLCMMIVLLMFYALIQVLHWAGMDLVERRKAHDSILSNRQLGERGQLRSDFYRMSRMNAVWDQAVGTGTTGGARRP